MFFWPHLWKYGIFSDNDLEDVVSKAITKAGVEVSDKGIEDCHQVGKRGTIIVSFVKERFQSKF